VTRTVLESSSCNLSSYDSSVLCLSSSSHFRLLLWYFQHEASPFLKAVKILADLCTLVVVIIGAVTAKAYAERGIDIRADGDMGPSGYEYFPC
jgi:uroporphyrinogen-III synthase